MEKNIEKSRRGDCLSAKSALVLDRGSADQGLNITLSQEVILKLLVDGALTACDILCLDSESQIHLRKLCMQSCAICICKYECCPTSHIKFTTASDLLNTSLNK